MSTPEDFTSCWIGDRLLPLANASIHSFRRHGFSFGLYTYGPVADVPEFVTRREAEALIPARELFIAHGGVETSTDLFIYRFLERIGGWYVDNDVVCNTTTIPDCEIAFAEERAGIINNAVLRFPPHHPAIIDLLRYVASVDARTAPWGAIGPSALTKVFNQHDLVRHMLPTANFYPLHWRDAPKLLFPEFTEEVLEKIDRAPFIHLWGSTLRELRFDFTTALPLKDSYLDLLYKDFLDPHVLERLRPLDEAAFRRYVKDYVEGTWNMPLALAR